MGINVVFKVRPHERMGQQQFEEIRQRFYEAHPDEFAGDGWRYPRMEWDPYEDEPTIEVSCTDRFYGSGYERGCWPQIEKLGDWLDAEFSGIGELRYGGDCADAWSYLTTWLTARIDNRALWDSVGNEPYYRAR